MNDKKIRFVFSMTEDTKQQLDILAKEQECSAASLLRRLIKLEFTNTRKNNK